MEYGTIKGIKHYVFFDINEYRDHFKELGMPAPIIADNWRNAPEGSWVYSDDGSIVQILKRYNLRRAGNTKNYQYSPTAIRTIVGSFTCRDTDKMDTDFSDHPNRYTFSRKKLTNLQRVRNRKYITSNEQLFVANFIAGHGLKNSYMDAYGIDNDLVAKKRAIILLRQERIMKEIEKSVIDIASDMGLTHQWVLENLKELAEDGASSGLIKLNAIKEVGKAIGTTSPTIKERTSGVIGLFQGFDPEQLNAVKRPSLEIPESTNNSNEEQ